jgi:hypothetical protein
MPSCCAISLLLSPRATRPRMCACRRVTPAGRDRSARTARAQVQPHTPPSTIHPRPRRSTRGRTAPTCGEVLARLLQNAPIGSAHDLVLESLEEELPAAARAERLIRVAPRGSLAAGLRIRDTELLDGRTARLCGHQDLPESMSAEVAVELSTYGHRGTSRHSQRQERRTPLACSSTPQAPAAFHKAVRIRGTSGFPGRTPARRRTSRPPTRGRARD